MTTEDFKHLEELLGKMKVHLGHRFCIVPNAVHDGYHVAIYDDKGDVKATDTWTDLKTVAERLMRVSAKQTDV